jgi:Tfp pilus assembly protein PilF
LLLTIQELAMTVAEVLAEAWQHHRAGQLQWAEQLYLEILQRLPSHAGALAALGAIALQTGRAELAAQYLGDAVTADPSQAHYQSNLALAHRALGNLPAAEAALREALRLQPDNPEIHNNLGTVLYELQRPTEAEAAWRRTLQLRPDHAEACTNLGTVLLDLGRAAEAAVAFQEALRLDPRSVKARHNLGLVFQTLGDLPAAENAWREALRLDPFHAESHQNLGTALLEMERPNEAETFLREAVRLKPHRAEALLNLGRTLYELDRSPEAEQYLQEALTLAPGNVKTLNNLGAVYQDLGKLSEAETVVHEALHLSPDYANAHHNLGMVFLERGLLGQAEQHLREAIRCDPNHAGAYSQLAVTLRARLPDADRTAMERLLADTTLGEGARSALHFGLAQVCDAEQDYRGAAGHLREANALALARTEKSGQGYDPAEHSRFVTELVAAFTADFFSRIRGWGSDTELPVFIVGLPRSGTTLLEQILSSHPQVHGAGELRFIHEAFASLPTMLGAQASPLACLGRLDRASVDQMASTCLDRYRRLAGSAVRIVDKLPDNYLYLGLIAVLFPRAKIIHCRRDLRDVAVSCWITKFRQIRWANNASHIAARFADYRRIMDHWRQVLPVSLLEVDYEETVSDLEGVARRLLAWCGLEWDPACLAFHETWRPVRTASAVQVRQPIYRQSVGRWENYEDELGDLFAHLPST